MPILDIQQRTRELGRIRTGRIQPDGSGKSRPEKLDRFRLTSASRPLLEQVAELYGGAVAEWTPANGGPRQWEVVTDAARLPVMVPPQAVSQWYESWSGGGCRRRCDGRREVLTDSPCPCGPDPAARECKPTTRLNVVLRDVPGVGVWRLESHGYYAAVELPAVADMLARTRGYISAWLALEERTAKREGQTRRWMVPTLEVDITPSALMAGEAQGGVAPAVAHDRAPAVEGGKAAAIEAPPSPARDWRAEIGQAQTPDEVRDLYRACTAAGEMTGELSHSMKERADLLRQADETGGRVPDEGPAPVPDRSPDEAAPVDAPVDDGADEVWMQCVAAWSGSTTDLMHAYAAAHGGELPDDATAEDLTAFLADIRAGQVTVPGGRTASS